MLKFPAKKLTRFNYFDFLSVTRIHPRTRSRYMTTTAAAQDHIYSFMHRVAGFSVSEHCESFIESVMSVVGPHVASFCGHQQETLFNSRICKHCAVQLNSPSLPCYHKTEFAPSVHVTHFRIVGQKELGGWMAVDRELLELDV